MIDSAPDSLLLQHLRHGLRFAPAHAVNNPAFSAVSVDKLQNRLVLFFCLKASFDSQADVRPVERRNKGTGVNQMQLADNIFASDFIRSSG